MTCRYSLLAVGVTQRSACVAFLGLPNVRNLYLNWNLLFSESLLLNKCTYINTSGGGAFAILYLEKPKLKQAKPKREFSACCRLSAA